MNETAQFLKTPKVFLTEREARAHALGMISGFLIANYNHADRIGLRTHKNLMAMIERGASHGEITEYLVGTVGEYA
ncbi:MAG: hypothetical protein AB7F88_07210 [Pyrinomonadaceae bacterium]